MDYPIRFTDQLRPQIRALRKTRGLTQGELGHQLGVGQARIAEIERSPGTVSVDQMLKLLSLLGASLVLRDSLSAEPAAEPNRKSIKKPAGGTVKKRPQVSSSGTWTQRTPSGGSVLVERNSLGAPKAKDLKALQKPSPKASVAPTSARHYVIRPKKGSW